MRRNKKRNDAPIRRRSDLVPRSWCTAFLITALALGMPAVSGASDSYGAFTYALVNYDSTTWAIGWNFLASSTAPDDAEACLSDGGTVTDEGNFWYAADVSIPFSGSNSGTSYFTVCYDSSNYAVLEFTIDLTDCFLWVCTSTFTSSFVTEVPSGSYSKDTYLNGLANDIALIYVPDVSD